MLLSDLYARSRGNYASRSGNHRRADTGDRLAGKPSNLSQNTTTSADSGSSPSSHAGAKKPSKHDIMVHQSIEMTSHAVQDDALHTRSGSRDGSESNLVFQGVRTEAFASNKSRRKSEFGSGRRTDAGHMV